MTDQPFVVCDNLVKTHKVANLEVVALQGLNLEVRGGEVMALVGPSGAGKTTLLNVIGGLDAPSSGRVQVAGWDLLAMEDRQRVKYKREVVGFVWQQPARNLLSYLTARENVELPMILAGLRGGRRAKRAMELLEVVGLADRAGIRPDRLSGGEKQRVAVAVALANHPPLLLGDELTGQIDSQSSWQVFETLRRVNEVFETTIILVTHDPLVSGLVDRVVAIHDGRTSTEICRQRDQESGDSHEEEWMILDRPGRLKLHRPYVEKPGFRERVKVRLEDDPVTVWPQSKVREFIRLGAPDLSHLERVPQAASHRNGTAVRVENLRRTFTLGAEEVHAIRDLSLEVPSGILALVSGRSGSGKTTLLNLIAGLDEPTRGSVWIGERCLAELTPSERVAFRRKSIGFIYQTFGLLPFLSVEENVELPLRLVRAGRAERKARVSEALALVGLSQRARHRTHELSGGEQQRAAIARALANRPDLILADEPTGQLDSATGASILQLLRDIASQTGVTVLVASHDANVRKGAELVFELRDGQLEKTVAG